MIILLHSSKTMKSPRNVGNAVRQPQLIAQAKELHAYLKTLSVAELAKTMQLSNDLAQKTHAQIATWSTIPEELSFAIDSFVGDIYSGLQASDFSKTDRAYADTTLRILSGLYGILMPLDAISPYRLEMGYKLPDERFRSLYTFWADNIARCLPPNGPIVNLTAVEYAKTITPFVDTSRIIAPKFLTISPKTHQPTFVTVHAKVARGAFAHWMIKHRIQDVTSLQGFNELGYTYNKELSTPAEPVFVCQEFGGLGLSIRLV